MRIAILLTAYKNAAQLNRLVDHLSRDFDVYIHIDKRSPITITEKQHVFVYKKYRSYWGSINTVLAVIYLFKMAFPKSYERYLLITGQDIPIKSNTQISEFFSINSDKEYFEYLKLPTLFWNNGGMDRIDRYWPLEYGHLSGLHSFIAHVLSWVQKRLYASRLARFFKRPIDYEFYGGSNYMDLTGSCVAKVLEYIDKHPRYIRRFLYTRIPEEIFFQTIILSLPGLEIENLVLRYVDWESGPEYPKVLDISDLNKVKRSPAIFARKVDERKDNMIIDAIYSSICNTD